MKQTRSKVRKGKKNAARCKIHRKRLLRFARVIVAAIVRTVGKDALQHSLMASPALTCRTYFSGMGTVERALMLINRLLPRWGACFAFMLALTCLTRKSHAQRRDKEAQTCEDPLQAPQFMRHQPTQPKMAEADALPLQL